jgi:hypothetical protein
MVFDESRRKERERIWAVLLVNRANFVKELMHLANTRHSPDLRFPIHTTSDDLGTLVCLLLPEAGISNPATSVRLRPRPDLTRPNTNPVRTSTCSAVIGSILADGYGPTSLRQGSAF